MQMNNTNRPYIFSAEMNLRTMYSMALWAYAAIFADGANGALRGELVIPGQAISAFWLQSIIVGSILVIAISFLFYLRALKRATIGENGAKYYASKPTSPVDYIKNTFVLLVLVFFIGLQIGFIYDGIQSGYELDEMIYVIFLFMCMAALAGIAGLIQTALLHLRYVEQQ